MYVPADAEVTVRFRGDNEGMWMFHCHILEHAEAGMMAELDVERTSTDRSLR